VKAKTSLKNGATRRLWVKTEKLELVSDENGRQSIDARELHGRLGVNRDFSNWIKGRIEEYGFTEGEDFQRIAAKAGDYSRPGNPNFVPKDYLLTLGMAKEIALVENNQAGRELRRYLIRVEEAWKAGIEQERAEYKALVQETINNVLPGSEISGSKRLYGRYDLTSGGRVYAIKAGGNRYELVFYGQDGAVCTRTVTKGLKGVPLAVVVQLRQCPSLGKCTRYSGIWGKWVPLNEARDIGCPVEVAPDDYLVWVEGLRKKEAPALEESR
jgi:phage anti-repressor protein